MWGLAVATLFGGAAVPASGSPSPSPGVVDQAPESTLAIRAPVPRTPIVFFPGYGTSRLLVTVDGQTQVEGCPRQGSFEDPPVVQPGGVRFSPVCRDRLLTLRYDSSATRPMSERFTRPRGVRVQLVDFGKTTSAPSYQGLFDQLVAAGYTADEDLRVASYNFRLTPDMDDFLARTKDLIEETYRRNGDQPVRLVGHSQGPVYALYLLHHVSETWKRTYLQGFTAIAGNFPGQGFFYASMFTGLELSDEPFPTDPEHARSSARLMVSSPTTYLAAADPGYFGSSEVVVKNATTGRGFTPADFPELLRRMRRSWAIPIARHYLGFVPFSGPADAPGVDTSVEVGWGLPTPIGVVLPTLRSGQVLDVASSPFLLATGDLNQEDTTNEAAQVWGAMPCHRFRFTGNLFVRHDLLPQDPGVVTRLLADLEAPPSACPGPP